MIGNPILIQCDCGETINFNYGDDFKQCKKCKSNYCLNCIKDNICINCTPWWKKILNLIKKL